MVFTPLSHANINVKLLLCLGLMRNGTCEAAQDVKSCMALLEFGLESTNASLQLTLTEAQPAYCSSMQIMSCNQFSKCPHRHAHTDMACTRGKRSRHEDGTRHHCISVVIKLDKP